MSATRPAAGSHNADLQPGRGFRPEKATEEEVELYRMRDRLQEVINERNAALAETEEARQLHKERVQRIREACDRLEAENDRLTRHVIALRRHVGEETSRAIAATVEGKN